MQFTDGFTGRSGTVLQSKHRDGWLNGGFLDGHAHRVTLAEWQRVDRDAQGYFSCIAAADR